jgi:hypothetical protein
LAITFDDREKQIQSLTWKLRHWINLFNIQIYSTLVLPSLFLLQIYVIDGFRLRLRQHWYLRHYRWPCFVWCRRFGEYYRFDRTTTPNNTPGETQPSPAKKDTTVLLAFVWLIEKLNVASPSASCCQAQTCTNVNERRSQSRTETNRIYAWTPSAPSKTLVDVPRSKLYDFCDCLFFAFSTEDAIQRSRNDPNAVIVRTLV